MGIIRDRYGAVRTSVLAAIMVVGSSTLAYLGNPITQRHNKMRIEHRNLFQKVEYVADSDRNFNVDSSEWSKAYEEIGLTYDTNNSNPRQDLTIEQMRCFLCNPGQNHPRRDLESFSK